MSISMKRYNDTIITPKDDRILFDQIFDDYGLIYGGSATMAASNKIHVGAARGFIKGTEVIIEAEDIAVNLSDSGTKNGRLKIVMDLADTETPIKFESEVAASFPALEQDANINYDNGRYEVVFATYKTTETTISSVTLVMPTMQSVKAKIQGINQSLDGCLKSVSDGKKTVASAITAQGVSTAADAEFATMAANIGSVGTNKYSAGRRQGRSDVTSSPNSYGLYTKSQYDSNYSTGQANGSNSAKSNGSKSAIWLIRNNSPASLLCYDGNYFTASGNTVYCKESGSYLIANEGYSLSGNININGSSSWYGDCNVYHGGTTRSLPAGGYITPNISANSSSGSAGIIIVRKA